MADIDTMLDKIDALDFEETMSEVLESQRYDLAEFQRGQMLLGENAEGGKIGKYRNKNYARVKFNEYNPLAGYGNVDLKLTGDFQREILVDVRDSEKEIVFTSADPKTTELVNRYGEEIFGLNEKTAAEYSELYFAPAMQEKIFDAL